MLTIWRDAVIPLLAIAILAAPASGQDGGLIEETDLLTDKGLLYVKTGNIDLSIKGFLQFDFEATENDASLPAPTGDGFAIRDCQLIVSAKLKPYVELDLSWRPWGSLWGLGYIIDLDLKATVRLHENLEEFRVVLGQYRIPFSQAGLVFRDPLPKQLCVRAPRIFEGGAETIHNRDLGMHAEGDLLGKRIYYALGFCNGEGPNRMSMQADFPIFCRLLFTPFRDVLDFLGGLQIGGGCENGEGWESFPGMGTYNDGRRERYCATFRFEWRGILIEAEFMRINMSIPGPASPSVKISDAYVQAAYMIKIFKDENFHIRIQPLVRVEQYDPQIGTAKNTETRVTAGFNFFLSDHFMLAFNYGHYTGNADVDAHDNEGIVMAQISY